MKTFVRAKHAFDCPESVQNNGCCPGEEKAMELNRMGADEEPFGDPASPMTVNGQVLTNRMVRENWLSDGFGHLDIDHVEE